MKSDRKTAILRVQLFAVIACVLLLTSCSLWNDVSSILNANPPFSSENMKSFAGRLKLRHGDPETMYRLAVHYQQTGRHDWAMEEFRNILAIEPSFARAYNGIGVSLDHHRKFALAQKAYLKALEIDSELDYVWNNLGYSTLLQGEPEAAAAYFAKAIALRSGNPRYHNNLLIAKHLMDNPNVGVAEAMASVPGLIDSRLAGSERHIPPEFTTSVLGNMESHDDGFREIAPSSHAGLRPFAVAPLFGDRAIPANPRQKKAHRVIVRPFEARSDDITFSVKPVVQVHYRQKPQISSPTTITLDRFPGTQHSEGILLMNAAVRLVEAYKLDKVISDSEGPYIEIANGNGIAGMARRVQHYLKRQGFPVIRASNADHFDYAHTKLYYREGFLQQAWTLAKAIPGQQNFEKLRATDSKKIDIKVVLGNDMRPYLRRFKDSA